MSTPTIHTLESLDALGRKADVAAIAAERGLSTEGSRAELTQRILEAQTATDTSTDDLTSTTPVVVVTPVQPVTEDIDIAVPVADEVTDEFSTVVLSSTGKLALEQLVASFFGAADTPDIMDTVYSAVEAGKQPCIVVGRGNVRFAIEVFEEPFDSQNCSKDADPEDSRVSVNLARALYDKGLYPVG